MVIRRLESVRQQAEAIADDERMLGFFKTVRRGSMNSGRADGRNLEFEIDRHCVARYGAFFDILFVDREGFVLHSLRKESDYHTRLFTGSLSDTRLAEKLRNSVDGSFVEYECYPPSDEPAAFFAVPIREGSARLGWFVLQYPINEINAVLADRAGLGRTGEVYLVNTGKMMLTDSRFMAESSAMKLSIDTRPLKDALRRGAGEGVAADYRGVRVLSAAERFELLGASWVIVAQIDEAEVITEHYRRHAAYYLEEIARYLSGLPREARPAEDGNANANAKRVDMNEVARALPGGLLRTFGVGPCTGIVASHPGKVGYLAHIGPADAIYGRGGSARSDLLREMLERMKRHDAYASELRQLDFTIVATHLNSFGPAVERLLDSGIELAGIKFMYNPTADCARILFDPAGNTVKVEWISGDRCRLALAADTEDLGQVVKRLSGYGLEP